MRLARTGFAHLFGLVVSLLLFTSGFSRVTNVGALFRNRLKVSGQLAFTEHLAEAKV